MIRKTIAAGHHMAIWYITFPLENANEASCNLMWYEKQKQILLVVVAGHHKAIW